MQKNDIKLYNVFFPFWMLLLFPQMWLVIFPANFIIDSLVLIIGMAILKVAEKKRWYKRHIFKIFAFGMLSDMISSGCLLLIMMFAQYDWTGDDYALTIPAIIVASALIFLFNYFITFRKDDKLLRLKFSLIFAIVTAPYTFLIPTSWLYF